MFFSNGLTIKSSWINYREFEVQPKLVDPDRFRLILDELLELQPSMEYFGRRFRRCFDRRSGSLASEVLLPSSCVVRSIHSSFVWEEFVETTSDNLLLNDSILLGPENGPVTGPDGSSLWVYAVFGNSPILTDRSQYEIRLGATAAVRQGSLLFLADTEMIYPHEYLSENSSKIRPDHLARIFPRTGTTPRQVSLLNSWPAGPTVKSSTIHAEDIASIPAQLSDPVFICANVRAKVRSSDGSRSSRMQYAGFQRGRVSEQLSATTRASFSLSQFVLWARELGSLIQSKKRTPPEFFTRYLSAIEPPAEVRPTFMVFNLFETDIELIGAAGEPLELVDSIVQVERIGDDGELFQAKITFRDTSDPGSNPRTFKLPLFYEQGTSRFRLMDKELNTEVLVAETGGGDDQGFVTYLNRHDDLYTLSLLEPDTFYTGQAFYRFDYKLAESQVASAVETWAPLRTAVSEKGKTNRSSTHWQPSSVFGIIDSRRRGSLMAEKFGRYDLMVCDDLDVECADFVCADFANHKIAFIHAKSGDEHLVSGAALHDVIAQALKNLRLVSRSGIVPKNLAWWNRNSRWRRTRIRRWRFGSAALPAERSLWARIQGDILEHPNRDCQIWLVLGAALQKDELLRQLKDAQEINAVSGHVVYLLSSLRTACTQLNAKLRIFAG